MPTHIPIIYEIGAFSTKLLLLTFKTLGINKIGQVYSSVLALHVDRCCREIS